MRCSLFRCIWNNNLVILAVTVSIKCWQTMSKKFKYNFERNIPKLALLVQCQLLGILIHTLKTFWGKKSEKTFSKLSLPKCGPFRENGPYRWYCRGPVDELDHEKPFPCELHACVQFRVAMPALMQPSPKKQQVHLDLRLPQRCLKFKIPFKWST